MSETVLQPIKKMRLSSQVADLLREMILSGHFKPGEHLLQDKLAIQLGVSRTPLREALLKLQEEGLIRLSGARGVEVTRLDPAEILELYEVREVLDGLAARLAATNATPAELAGTKSILDEVSAFVEHPDLHEWLVLNVRFHDSIIEASHNRALKQLSSYVNTSSRMFHPLMLHTPQRTLINYQQHLRIYEAIVARDAGRAEAAAKEHIASIKAVVRGLMQNQ